MSEPDPTRHEAERTLLGAAMVTNRPLDILAGLASEHFSQPLYRRTYRAICDLGNSGDPVDILTVQDRLQRQGGLLSDQEDMLFALGNDLPAVFSSSLARRVILHSP